MGQCVADDRFVAEGRPLRKKLVTLVLTEFDVYALDYVRDVAANQPQQGTLAGIDLWGNACRCGCTASGQHADPPAYGVQAAQAAKSALQPNPILVYIDLR